MWKNARQSPLPYLLPIFEATKDLYFYYPRPTEENFERNLDKIHEHGRNLKTDANRRKSSKEAVIHAQKKLLTAM